MNLSLPKRFPLLYFVFLCLQVSSVCNFCPETGGKGGHLFRLTCSIVLRGGMNTANKYHWHVWGVRSVSGPHWVCPHSQHVCFPSLHCSGSRLLCREQALGCVHCPGLSHSGSGSQVLHKGTDSVVPAFCALPRSEQLRPPDAWRVHSPKGWCVLSPSCF